MSGCTNAFVDVNGVNPATTFKFDCQGTEVGSNPTAASGYIGYAQPHSMMPEQIWINACATANGAAMAGSIAFYAPIASVGSTSSSTVTFDSGTDSYSNAGTGTLTITELGQSTIAGSYSATVTPSNNGTPITIMGTFNVCRGPDFLPP